MASGWTLAIWWRPLPWVWEGLSQVEEGWGGLALWLQCGEGDRRPALSFGNC